MRNNIYTNMGIVLGAVVVLLIVWLILRVIIGFLDDRINFLAIATPGDVASMILVFAILVFVIAAALTWGDQPIVVYEEPR